MEPPRELELGWMGRASRVIPRLTTPEEWGRTGGVRRWLLTVRAIAFPMTLLSVAWAGVYAYRDGTFRPGLWLLLLVGLLAAHATNNLLNDLIDRGKGVDVAGYFRHDYNSNPLALGLLTERQAWATAVGTGAAALAIAVLFVVLRGRIAADLVALGAVFVVFYTWPLKYVGLGEPIVFLVWGPLMIAGGAFAISGRWSPEVALASLPYGLTASTILFGKHIEKHDPDRAKGIRTLPVLLGERNARRASVALMALAYLLLFGGVALRIYPVSTLIVVLGLPTMFRCARAFLAPKPASCPARYPRDIWPAWYVALAVWHDCTFGSLVFLGLLADAVARRLV